MLLRGVPDVLVQVFSALGLPWLFLAVAFLAITSRKRLGRLAAVVQIELQMEDVIRPPKNDLLGTKCLVAENDKSIKAASFCYEILLM